MADEVVVGSVAVTVTASAKGFARSLRQTVVEEFGKADLHKALSDAIGKVKVKVPFEPDPDTFKDLPKQLPKPPKVPVELDPLVRQFQADARKAAAALAKQVKAKIPATADTAELRSNLAAEIRAIETQLNVKVPTEPAERREYEQKLRALVELVEARVTAHLPVDVPEAEVVAEVAAAVKTAEKVAPPVKLKVDVDKLSIKPFVARLTGLLSTALKGAGGAAIGLSLLSGLAAGVGALGAAVAGLGGALTGAIPVLVSFATAAATAAGSLAVLPGAVAVAAAGVATLKIGLIGLEDTFKALNSGDPEKLAEALENLAPNARALVLAVQKLQPAFRKLRLDVQQRLFANTGKTLESLAKASLPTLTAGFGRLATTINAAVVGAVNGLNTAANQSALGGVLAAADTAARNLGTALQPIGQALLDAVGVGAQLTAELTTGVGGAIADMAARISEMAKSGELRQLILDGIDALTQFLALGKDLLGIVGGIAKAAGGAENGGLFTFFEKLNEAINSTVGQEALGRVFDALGRAGDALLPVLVSLLEALVPLAEALSRMAEAFAPGLEDIVDALAAGIDALTPALVALAPALVAVAGAITPLATLLTGLIQGFTPGFVALVEGLATAFDLLAPSALLVGLAIGEIATIIGEALVPVGAILGELIKGIAPGIATFLDGLAGALHALLPVAAPVGQAIGAVVSALAPLLPMLGSLLANALLGLSTVLSGLSAEFGPLIGVFAEMATGLANSLLPVLFQLAKSLLPPLVTLGQQVAQAFLPLVPVIIQIGQAIAGQLIAVLPQLVSMFQSDLFPIILEVSQVLAGQLLQALTDLLPVLPDLVTSGVELAFAMTDLLVAVLPLLPVMIQLFSRTETLQTGINLLATALNIVTGLVFITSNALKVLVSFVTGAIKAFSGLNDTVTSTVGDVRATVSGFGPAITSAIGDTTRLLYDAGRNIVQGLINGIGSMFGSLRDKVSSLAGTIRDYLPFSPAKLGPLSGSGNPYFSGQSIGELLAGGMVSRTGAVGRAAAELAAMVEFGGAMDPWATPTPALAAAGATTNHYSFASPAPTIEQLRALDAERAIRARWGRAG